MLSLPPPRVIGFPYCYVPFSHLYDLRNEYIYICLYRGPDFVMDFTDNV